MCSETVVRAVQSAGLLSLARDGALQMNLLWAGGGRGNDAVHSFQIPAMQASDWGLERDSGKGSQPALERRGEGWRWKEQGSQAHGMGKVEGIQAKR